MDFEFCAGYSIWCSKQGQLNKKNKITSENQPRKEYTESDTDSQPMTSLKLVPKDIKNISLLMPMPKFKDRM